MTATYDAYVISLDTTVGAGNTFSVTAADDTGFNIYSESNGGPGGSPTDVFPTGEVLGASDTGDAGTDGVHNAFYTSILTAADSGDTGTPAAVGSSGGSDYADYANDLQYLGTATVNGVEGFIARVYNYAPGGDTQTNTYLFIQAAGSPSATGYSGTIDYLPAYDLSGNASLNTAGTDGDWNLSTGTPDVSCFLGDTLIATPDGQVPVKALKAGDSVLTAAGAVAQVRWVGRSEVSRLFADPVRVLPVRVKAGALAENVPARDLLLSAGHALVIDDLLVHAGALVNGTTIVRDRSVPQVFTYYHIELDTHEVILAEGAPAETFLVNAEDMNFDNWAERPAQAAAASELPMPRVKAARQLPAAIRSALAARAQLLAGEFAAAA